MDKITLIIGRAYDEQNANTKAEISEYDFKEIENLIIFKKKLKKVLTNNKRYVIVIIEIKKRKC